MKNTTRAAWVAAASVAILLVGIASAPALAHHSFAMYDTSIEKTMTGKLIRYVLGSNHSQYVFQVMNPDGSLAVDAAGEPLIWNVETAAAAQLATRGITVESFKIGTIFTVTFSPLRDGRNGGAQRGAGMIMCGMKLPEGGCNEKTGKRF
jgi:Family of unknown function (DUF6152)